MLFICIKLILRNILIKIALWLLTISTLFPIILRLTVECQYLCIKDQILGYAENGEQALVPTSGDTPQMLLGTFSFPYCASLLPWRSCSHVIAINVMRASQNWERWTKFDYFNHESSFLIKVSSGSTVRVVCDRSRQTLYLQLSP